MAITRVAISDYLVFKNKFTADFQHGINVFIGDNGTGKTTLLKVMYTLVKTSAQLETYPHPDGYRVRPRPDAEHFRFNLDAEHESFTGSDVSIRYSEPRRFIGVYIPEKDILEHAKGLLTFIEQKPTGFSQRYKDLLIAAQDIPMYEHEQSGMQKSIGDKIKLLIDGIMVRDEKDGSFYTVKTDGTRIPFANEASGYKKLGYLGLLVSSGQLKKDTILFWDEPENSLNPDHIPKVVEILLELAQNGIQIFIATHDYNLTRHLDVRKDKGISVQFHNLIKTDDGSIKCQSSPKYTKLEDNLLDKASADLFKAVVSDAFGIYDDE